MTGAWPICGDCPDCLEATNALLRVPKSGTVLPGPAPTAAALEKHAAKFGPAMVVETAQQYGLSVAVERPRSRPKGRGGPSLTDRIITMLEAGHDHDTIAAVEDLTPARAKRELGKALAKMNKEAA